MKCLCLVYAEEKLLADIHDAECMAGGDGLRASGYMIGGNAPQPAHMATTLRVRDGRLLIPSMLPGFADSPQAETDSPNPARIFLPAVDSAPRRSTKG
jgi:hypothetical protein